MNIAYFDFNCSPFYEDYSSINPHGYGGGSVFGRWGRIHLNNKEDNFYLFAPKECFKNIKTQEDRPDRCISVDNFTLDAFKKGYPISKVIDLNNFDLVLYHNSCEHNINLGYNIPLCCWAGSGLASAIGFSSNYGLLYNHKEKIPQFSHQKIKYVQIGKSVPETFQEYKKEDYVIQVSQHCRDFNTLEVCQQCLKYNIPLVLAGPINDYKELNDIIENNNLITYLGQISEQEKLELYKKARLLTLFNKNKVPFNQSIIEAQSLGTPVFTTQVGWYREYVNHGVNGFFYDGNNFLECYNNAPKMRQKDCWSAAKQYDIPSMISSFKSAFNEILHEWKL